MIDNRIEPFSGAFEPCQTLGSDAVANAFAESLEPLLQLAELAYAYSSTAELVSTGRRQVLERVGIRAVDLLVELAAFIKDEI